MIYGEDYLCAFHGRTKRYVEKVQEIGMSQRKEQNEESKSMAGRSLHFPGCFARRLGVSSKGVAKKQRSKSTKLPETRQFPKVQRVSDGKYREVQGGIYGGWSLSSTKAHPPNARLRGP